MNSILDSFKFGNYFSLFEVHIYVQFNVRYGLNIVQIDQ